MFRKALLTTAATIAMFALSSVARADTIFVVGSSTGSLSTATVSCSMVATNTFRITVTNTSPFDARITGIGFDLVAGDVTEKLNQSSGINGFSSSNVAGFSFTDLALGNVPQFNTAVLDFGFTTGSGFSGGSPNSGLDNGQSLTFTVSGAAFANMSEEDICQAIFLRFQRVGANGNGSDVGHGGQPGAVPEPMTMLLFGTGLAGVAARARRRRSAKA